MAEVKRRRKKYGRARKKRENWFTRLPLWSKILMGVIAVLLCIVLVAAWYLNSKLNKLDRTEIKPEDLVINEEVKKSLNLGDGYTNIALFGVDSREGNMGAGTLSDAIIVASINNKTKEIRMVSVYRDTFMNLSDGTYSKCNAAYSYGGPVQAINMLNTNLDLDIEDYVTVNFTAIADGVDMVGGIDIEITEEELEELNYQLVSTAWAVNRSSEFLDHAGMVHMNGLQATTYARIRSTAGGDFTRTERQRLVIEKVVEKLKQTDLKTLDAMINEMFPKISTSLTLTEMLTYATGYKEFTLGENTGFPYHDLMSTDTFDDYGSINIPRTLVDNVSRVHEFLFGTQNYVPSSTVQANSSKCAALIADAESRRAAANTPAPNPEPQPGDGGNEGTPPADNRGNGETTPPDNSGNEETTPPDNSGDTGTTPPDTGTTPPNDSGDEGSASAEDSGQ